jgi:translation initiation factor IF-2
MTEAKKKTTKVSSKSALKKSPDEKGGKEGVTAKKKLKTDSAATAHPKVKKASAKGASGAAKPRSKKKVENMNPEAAVAAPLAPTVSSSATPVLASGDPIAPTPVVPPKPTPVSPPVPVVPKVEKPAPVVSSVPPPVAKPVVAKPIAAAVPRTKIIINESVTVKELAEKIAVKIPDLLKKLLGLGVIANLNQRLDTDTATLAADSLWF